MSDINFKNAKSAFENMTTIPALQNATAILTEALALPELESEWAERCFDCLKVPVPEGVYGLGPVKPWWDLYRAALFILVRLEPAGIAKRLLELINGSAGKVIKDAFQGGNMEGSGIAWPARGSSVIPTNEIGIILDWYEKLSAREAGYELRFWLEGMIKANGDASTIEDLKRRLENPKLKKPKRASYESVMKDLNELLARGT